MDRPLPDDFDPYEVRVNYGVQNNNGNGNGKALWWLLGGLMALYVMLTGAYIVWTGNAIVALTTDVAVIKCQLSKPCREGHENAGK